MPARYRRWLPVAPLPLVMALVLASSAVTLWILVVLATKERTRGYDVGAPAIESRSLQLQYGSNEGDPYGKGGTHTDTDSCWHLEPWFTRSHWDRTQLVFYGKPSMQVIKSVANQRRWRVKITGNSSAFFKQSHSMKEDISFMVVYTTSLQLGKNPILQKLANSRNALVSGIRNAYKVTGAKKGQLETFRGFFKSFGCTLEQVNIMPRSFLMDNDVECLQFFKYASQKERLSISHAQPPSMWVLKTSSGYGGDGVTILPNTTLLLEWFGNCQNTNKKEYIAQEYIKNILLIEGRKFDVRGIVLIAGTNPYMLFYHEGYLRVSVHQFESNGGREVHLTNSHVQVTSKGFDPEKHFWTFSQFQEYLDLHLPQNDGYVYNTLIPFIKKVGLFLLQAGEYVCLLSCLLQATNTIVWHSTCA